MAMAENPKDPSKRPKCAPFPGWNANLPHCTCFTRLRVASWPLGALGQSRASGSDPPPHCYRPVKRKSQTSGSHTSANSVREFVLRAPAAPQVRALQHALSNPRISTTSLPSILTSGLQRPHPYAPAGKVSGETSYEIASSVATQAFAELSPSDALESTPIPRSQSCLAFPTDSHQAQLLYEVESYCQIERQ